MTTEAKAPAPDFALPWMSTPTHINRSFSHVTDADGYNVATIDGGYADRIVSAVNNAAAKDAEIARLREALRFYADEGNHGQFGAVESDNGYRARAALSSIPTASDTDEVKG